jgi:hypothetical protein
VISDWLVPAVAAVLVVLAAVAVAVLLRDRRRVRAELAATRADALELRAELAELADRVSARAAVARREPEEFVITDVGDPATSAAADDDPAGPQRIDGRLFADLVLRESVVKAAALTHGVRRALAPEARNRIRFEMRREVKRSRKRRRETLRAVRREMHARERTVEEAS